MNHIKLVTIYGSPTPPGRLASVLNVAEKYAVGQSAQVKRTGPSLDESGKFFFWQEDSLRLIEEADAILIASPVFRGSIPAILKELLDLLPVQALRSKPVGLYVVGNAAEHYLGVERHITDILTWFGALYVPATCYITAPTLNDGIPANVMSQIVQLVDSTLILSKSLGGKILGPPPLAEVHGR
ncbi:NADPH-dependent FMN reductase [Siminovitchia sp. FSL W7-1587]|uniref:NADPH-dependent FMN reductase n=1 Tax=Siminovitchia sp. FSL W7-1587 TaxID=2954699 RepID=UPI0030CB435A